MLFGRSAAPGRIYQMSQVLREPSPEMSNIDYDNI